MQLPGTTNSATAKPCGIFWIVADEPVYLPLEQADIHADIVDRECLSNDKFVRKADVPQCLLSLL